MRSLRFWKRETTSGDESDSPAITRFGIHPRTDTSFRSLPDDPELAARAMALHARREALIQELSAAEEAMAPDNQWRRQAALISEALESVERDREKLAEGREAPGAALPPFPITDVSVSMDPVAAVQFRVADSTFAYAEELDWAERGTQIARSDLHRDEGEIEALIPADYPADQRAPMLEHLKRSMFGFATDIRDRSLKGQTLPAATLADLARPSSKYGGWLDWSGHSPVHQTSQLELSRLREEQKRLEIERAGLLEDEAKMVEAIPVIRRRLADVEQQLGALTASN